MLETEEKKNVLPKLESQLCRLKETDEYLHVTMALVTQSVSEA